MITKLLIAITLLASSSLFASEFDAELQKKQIEYEAFLEEKLNSSNPNDVIHAVILSSGSKERRDLIKDLLVPLASDTDDILLLDYLIGECLTEPLRDYCLTENWIKRARDLDPNNAKFDLYLAQFQLQQSDTERAKQSIAIAAGKKYFNSLYTNHVKASYQFLAELSDEKNIHLIAAIGAASATPMPQMIALSTLCSATKNPHMDLSEKSNCIKLLQLISKTDKVALMQQMAFALLEGLLQGKEKVAAKKAYEHYDQVIRASSDLQFIMMASPDLFVERLHNLGELETFQRYIDDNKKGD